MAHYRVGKKARYRSYIIEVLRVMYEAEVTSFTLGDCASWAGLPVTNTLRNTLDSFVLLGWLSVEAVSLRSHARPRTYRLMSLHWLKIG